MPLEPRRVFVEFSPTRQELSLLRGRRRTASRAERTDPIDSPRRWGEALLDVRFLAQELGVGEQHFDHARAVDEVGDVGLCQALEIADTLVRSGAIDVLVVDSVAALVPRSELEGEMGDVQPGSQARLMSQALRKLTASISKSRTMVVFINQIRMKIGVMYGSPETTSGGHALKFYASVRLDIRRIGAIKERDEVIGNQTRVKVVKNKLAPPFKQVEFDIMYGEGVSKLGELIDLGVKAGVVEKSGAWFSYDSQRIGQGRENAKTFLKQNPDIAAKIEAQVRQNSGIVAEAIMAGEGDKDDDAAAEA